MYSFSRQQRFPNASKPYCGREGYDIPTTKTKRGASIGYGTRFQHLVPLSSAPSPQKYEASNVKDRISYTFGTSRDKFQKVYLRENPPRDTAVPGPGHYSVSSRQVENSAAAFSMRPQTTYSSIFADPRKGFPGPGSYDSNRAIENKNGFYVWSKYKSPGGAVIAKTGKKYDDSQLRYSMEMPGPGYYTSKFNLKEKAHVTQGFSKANRKIILEDGVTRRQTPGPGSYRIQSDFGVYASGDVIGEATSLIMQRRKQMQSAGRY